MTLQPGQCIMAQFLATSAQVKSFTERDGYYLNPQLAVSVSQVDLLSHQIEAIYHYAMCSPQVPFLIADDRGAGKTIIVGLTLKELQLRQWVQRVLIVEPGPPQEPVTARDC